MSKPKRQRAVITLTDTDDGSFTADLTFEPSIKNRTVNLPCVNAAYHLARIIITAKDAIAQPPQISKTKPPTEESNDDQN